VSDTVLLLTNKKTTASGGLFIIPPPLSGKEWCGVVHLRMSLSSPPGGPEALWRDFGGGRGPTEPRAM
jgi:hypothetical protein